MLEFRIVPISRSYVMSFLLLGLAICLISAILLGTTMIVKETELPSTVMLMLMIAFAIVCLICFSVRGKALQQKIILHRDAVIFHFINGIHTIPAGNDLELLELKSAWHIRNKLVYMEKKIAKSAFPKLKIEFDAFYNPNGSTG